jgi:hypothetical protein
MSRIKKNTILVARSMKTTHDHTHDSWFSVKQGKFHIMKEDFKQIYRKVNTFFLPSRMKQEILSQWVRGHSDQSQCVVTPLRSRK